MPTGTITQLELQQHDRERVNLYIDSVFALGISLRTLEHQGLYKGKVLSESDWQAIAQAEEVDKAYNAALVFLAARPRSSQEIRTRLRKREFPDEHIDLAIEKLAQIGLVNDAAFARFWVENRQQHRPRGARAIQAELSQKGVQRDLISEVLNELTDQDEEQERAFSVARSALRRYANEPTKMAFSRKMAGLLQRRGFGFDTIKPVLDQLWQELQNNTEPDEID
ncbi:RecX family transcriptional regulator [Herpetosiphon giganteus]|uniref:RecX family transcriptional regulator n=1 Tax=Herpetosiphon giganteus TaxID=2029754 RepID=UPI0019572D99|nr:RecX family transcriptional regulator [Herpetosiphon giganteus]MBM7843348.1 regulatory protein [Herpetosiphon giganteus]